MYGTATLFTHLTPDTQFRLIVESWLRHVETKVKRHNLKPSTLRNYRQATKFIGRLGALPLSSLTCPIIEDWHGAVLEEHTSASAYSVYTLVRNVCNWARRRGLIQHNPASRLGITHEPAETLPLQPGQIRRYREALDGFEVKRAAWAQSRRRLTPGERFGYLSAPRALRFLESTGRRIGEVLSLRIVDVSFTARCILLPDTKCGPSAVVLSRRSLELARVQVDANKNFSPYLFPSPFDLNKHISKTTVWELHHEICGRAKIEGIVPHGLRYAWAFAALFGGADLRATGRVLGHRKLDTTERYARKVFVTPGMVHAAELAEAAKQAALEEVP